jgi:hypothetical protein
LSRAGGLAAVDTLGRIRGGDTPAAVQSLVSRMRFLRVFAGGYGVSEHARQVRELATDIGLLLGGPGVSGPEIETLERELSGLDPGGDMRQIITSSAAAEAQLAEAVASIRRTYSSAVIFVRPYMLRSATRRLDALADALPASELPWPQRFKALQSLDDSPQSTRLRLLITDAASAVAALRCARIAIALEHHRRETNQPAPSVDVLDLPGEVTEDPFTGNRLRYEQRADGYVIHTDGSADGQTTGRVSSVDVTVISRAR